MKKLLLISIIFELIVFSQSCTSIICGELEEDYKKKIDSVSRKFGNVVRVEHIPCEYRYANVFCLTQNMNDTILTSIHNILFDKKTLKGWLTLDVYDNSGKYIYSHNTNNEIYTKSGD